MSEYNDTFKIMILGEESTKKTSLTLRYISGYYMEDLKLTIGVDFYSKTALYKEKKYKLQIWDFGGEERFRFLLSQYCKGTNGGIFLYDITNPRTLDHISEWIHIVKENAGNVPLVLAGTNSDLTQHRKVSRDEGIWIAKKYNIDGFVEVSPKTGENVSALFELVIDLICQPRPLPHILEWRPPKAFPEDLMA